MRTMTNSWEGEEFYRSSFDPQTGALVRVSTFPPLPPPKDRWRETHLANFFCAETGEFPGYPNSWEARNAVREWWAKTFGKRTRPFSPVPETLDVQVTNWCSFGCEVCYQDSKPTEAHADKALIEGVLKSFKEPPYQIAFGGGEPTAHPDFPEILRFTRELGSVPNYTTAGNLFREEVIAATNEFCGGVALTYHVFKGSEWFRDTYLAWHEALGKHVQKNVHVIADNTVLRGLGDLLGMIPQTGPFNIVLLAYHPTGRGTFQQLMPKSIYHAKLPQMLADLREQGCHIAFSEGLLPYFFSRPELGIDMRYAERAEGFYSAYVDRFGRLSTSSFAPPFDNTWGGFPTYAEASLQDLWDKGEIGMSRRHPDQDICQECDFVRMCHAPHMVHSMVCKFFPHNQSTGRTQ